MENQAQKGYVFRRLCQQGTVDLVQQMLEAGAEVDNAQDDGCTGLWLASEAGAADVVRLLSAHRANTNIFKNPGNISALFIAAQNGHSAVVDVLLLNGANPNSPKTTGATPIFIASQQNFVDVVKSLLRAGANYSAPNTHGMSAIHIAAYQGNTEIVKLLLAAGADPFLAAQGRTAVEWATTNGHRIEVQRCVDLHLKSLEGELSRRKVDAFSTSVVMGGGGGGLDGHSTTSVGDSSDRTPPPVNPHTTGRGGGSVLLDGVPEPTGRYHVTPETMNSWYTPEFLVKSGDAGGVNASYFAGHQTNNRGTVTNVSVEGFGSPDRYSAARSQRGGNQSSSSVQYTRGAGGGATAGSLRVPEHKGLSLDAIDEEKKRSENFRRMNKHGNHTAQKAREVLENGGASSLLQNDTVGLISVEQEWDTYRAQLGASEDYLASTSGDVSDGWMYSAGATQRYTARMKESQQKMADAHQFNAEQERQSKTSVEHPGFTYPRLPPKAVEKLKTFMGNGRGAAGPPPPLAPEEITEDERVLREYKEPRKYYAIGGWVPEEIKSPAAPAAIAVAPSSPTIGSAKVSALSRLKNRRKE